MGLESRRTQPFASFDCLQPALSELRRLMPALSLLRKTQTSAAQHLSVPSDLFLVTVYCDDELECHPAGEGGDLEVVVSALRTMPCEFSSVGGGELAVAFLTPGGLLRAFGSPLEGMTDRRLPLAQFCGFAEQRRLRDALRARGTPQERLHAFGRWLESRMLEQRRLTGFAARVAQAAMQLCQHDEGTTRIGLFSAECAIGRRQLERDFRRWLGVSPGTLLRLVRFQRSAGRVLDGAQLLEAAVQHGYCDQSHMSRVFRQLTRHAPGELLSNPGLACARALRPALAGRLMLLALPPTLSIGSYAGNGDAKIQDPLGEGRTH